MTLVLEYMTESAGKKDLIEALEVLSVVGSDVTFEATWNKKTKNNVITLTIISDRGTYNLMLTLMKMNKWLSQQVRNILLLGDWAPLEVKAMSGIDLKTVVTEQQKGVASFAAIALQHGTQSSQQMSRTPDETEARLHRT